MALSNLIGRRRYHDPIDAAQKLAEKLCVNGLLLQFKGSHKIFQRLLLKAFPDNFQASEVLQ